VVCNDSENIDLDDGSSRPNSILAVSLPKKSEYSDMQTYSEDYRAAKGIADNQDLMVGIAWVLKPERHKFRMHGAVLHIDAVGDTNKEDRSLVTFTIRDSEGRQITCLRVFMPNERAWAFRWLFLIVLPTLLGVTFLQLIQVVVTDGDSQETSQLDIAIAKFFPQALQVRCGWHLVNRGLKRYGVGIRSVAPAHQDRWKATYSTIQLWMYTRMRSNCETEEEYNLSKYLFESFLRSDEVVEVAGVEKSEKILSFVRSHLQPHESHYCFHLKKIVQHFDTHINSAHEGTSKGIKYGAAPCLPNYSIQ
jgi:hypothetical protein